jgi:hypothetical protein
MMMDLRCPDRPINQPLQVLKKLSRALVGGLDTGVKLCMSWSRLARHQTYLNYRHPSGELFLQDRLFYDKLPCRNSLMAPKVHRWTYRLRL